MSQSQQIRHPFLRRGKRLTHACVIAIALFLCACLLTPTRADDPDPPPDNVVNATTVWQGPDDQFVTAAVQDQTGWWWGTDNDGLWHFAPDAKLGRRWQHFRAQDGLYDDSITALCVDTSGRLWVGTERRGVSVYNGGWWRNYDVMTGPLGVRVSAIAVNPKTGDVWIGSEEGIAIYSDRTKQWRYIAQADGLSSNDVTCIAFTPKGAALVGTAMEGLNIAQAAGGYKVWKQIEANPGAPDQEAGDGLPGDQINCLVVNQAGKIFCGTSEGLGWSADGARWRYLHGWHWQERMTPADRREHPGPYSDDVPPLMDEYVSSLAFDKAGHLYIGHRRHGVEVYDDTTSAPLYHDPYNSYGVDIAALAPLTTGGVLVGNYGGGIALICWDHAKSVAERAPPQRHGVPMPPIPAPAPDAPDLKAMSAKLTTLARNAQTPAEVAYFLGEDWQTQGDWLGRYGRAYAVLCAMDEGKDQILGTAAGYAVGVQLGFVKDPSEDVSLWMQWEQTGDPRVLFDPVAGVRREAEWNDQGDRFTSYSADPDMYRGGPDLWLTVQVPAGVHRLSLYFMNKDGHTRTTRFRDYLVKLKAFVPGVTIDQTYTQPDLLPTLAETRVSHFWPGVYENFVVSGPSKYYIEIDKNASLNTILQGVFLDRLDGKAHDAPPSATPVVSAAEKAWTQLNTLYADPAAADLQRLDRIALLRAIVGANAPPELQAQWRGKLGLWSGDDWARFDLVMQHTAKAAKGK